MRCNRESLSPDNDRKGNLVQQIIAAFSERRYPGDGHLVYDTSGQHLECDQIARAFEGKHWNSLSPSFIFSHNSALSFFSPEAFRYYLPAFLLAAITDIDAADIAVDSTISNLTVPDDANLLASFWENISGLTESEKKAIQAFLEFMRDVHGNDYPRWGPQEALRRYWATI